MSTKKNRLEHPWEETLPLPPCRRGHQTIGLKKRHFVIMMQTKGERGLLRKEVHVHTHSYLDKGESANERSVRWAVELNPGWEPVKWRAKEVRIVGKQYDWIGIDNED